MFNNWRFIRSWDEKRGSYGTALNEFVIEKNPEPTIIFRTMPLSLVLGVTQPYDTIDSDRAINDGVLICRRLTFGNAVLVSETQIEYAIIVGKKYYNTNRIELFDHIQAELFKILENIGAEGKLAPEKVKEGFANLNCMTGIAKNEILNHKGLKLISGVCTEFDNAYLQEGVIIMDKTIKDVVKYLIEDEWARENRKVVMPLPSSLEEELGRIPDREEIANTIYKIFDAEDYEISKSDLEEILEIEKKYNSDEWIRYGRYSK